MRAVHVATLALALAATLTGGADLRAGEARDYRYLLLQGKIGDKLERPLEGATILLHDQDDEFEARTDARGVFVFEKLPVADYDLEIRTPDGRVMRGSQALDRIAPDVVRFKIKLGRGGTSPIRLEAEAKGVTATAPEVRTKWKKLWIELAIFVGAAALLAL